MAEKIISPGVFTNEIDQSFLPAGVAAIGAAVIGPTQKGPAGIPTVVSNYSEYLQIFGGKFTSGSGASEASYKYLTNYAAQEYLKYADTLTVVRIGDGMSPASADVTASGVAANSFTLTSIADGADLNSSGSVGTNNLLAEGTENNFQYEIANVNQNKGTFTLLIRRGDDTINRKVILEQYNNLTLDPNSPNYIARAIGDQVQTLRDAGGLDPFLQLSGSYANRSKYVRVTVHRNTINYLDANGSIRVASATGSLPATGSGSFSGGSDGTVNHPRKYYETITNTNTGWPTFADNDIVQFALDLDNRKLWIGRNGTYINSGNPASGSNEQLAWTLSTNVSVMMLGYDGSGGGGAQSKWNFGNPPYSNSSDQSDANGYGAFEFQPPSGYFALCTKNLAEYG